MTQIEEKISSQNKLILMILVLGNFICLISETVMNVALPSIISEFGVNASTAQWLTSGYMLVIGISIPVSAFLIQRFTLRQLFITAVSFYSLGSLIAFITPAYPLLFAGRIIQALGTGIIMPLTMSVVLVLVPLSKRGTIMGILSVVIMLAPAIGPVISGFIIQYYSWRTIFLILLVLGLIVLFTATLKLRNITETKKVEIHIPSILLSTIGFGGLVYGFSTAGKEAGWANPFVWVTLAVGIVALILFVRQQNKMDSPMLNMEPFTLPIYSKSILLMFFTMMILFSMMLILPIYFQTALNMPPMETGLMMLPGGLILALIGLVAGKLFDKIGFKPLILSGLVIITIVLCLFTTISTETTIIKAMILYAIFTIGAGFALGPIMILALNQLPKPLYAHGSAIFNTFNQISGAIGPALYTSIMTMASQRFIQASNEKNEALLQTEALTKGVHTVFYVGLIFAVISFVMALTFKKKDQHVETV
ncbi:drug:H+ antiporter-2 (14 Spanner) (DHA2) family drug resistance MFS transporter [Bacillus cereus VD107]|nr:drug:H+ antiporter-2 (14 Spanner) (DHA2) family drug resistance MFS transporter [Bacillus cereus VD107]